MSKQSKPSIVFAHGLWADGSCFQKLIPALQADGNTAGAIVVFIPWCRGAEARAANRQRA